MNSIDMAISESKRFGDDLVRLAASTKGGTSALAMTGAGVGTLGNLSKQTSMVQLQEQYRHFMGWPYAVIRTIASRICGQPIRVARRVTETEQRKLDSWSMALKGSVKYRKWRQFMRRQPKKELLPEGMKDFHGKLDILDDHPIHDLIRHPNPIMVRSALIYVTFCSMELTGKAYWWFYRNMDMDGNQTLQIWPLPSSWVEPLHNDMDLYAEWEVRPPGIGEAIRVPGKEIGYMYYPDPANPLGSISPLQAMARAVVADEAIAESQRRGFAQGIFPGMGIVIGRHPDVAGVPGQKPILTKEQRSSLIAAIKQAYRGVQNEGEPVLLDGMIDDIKPLTIAPKEMGYMESGKFTKERITQGWGVNPISMGQVEGANRASSAVADDHLCQNVINPRLSQISEILSKWMPPLFGEDPNSLMIYFEMAKSFDADLERQNDQFLYASGAISRNELRAKYGHGPIKNGDSCFLAGFGEILIEDDDDVAQSNQGGKQKHKLRFRRMPS